MKRTPEYVLTVGDCPVAPGAELLLALVSRDSGRLVFWCSDCGCAWLTVPPLDRVDEVRGLQEVAPNGVRLAIEEDLSCVTLTNRPIRRHDYSDWKADLDAILV